MPFFIVTTLSTALTPSCSSYSSCWNIIGVFLSRNPTFALHCTYKPFLLVLLSFPFVFTQVCASSSVLAMKFTSESIFWWSVELNTFSNIFFNSCVSLFILTISLMALNPSIGYSISPEVTRYDTFNVPEFVSSPT